MRRFDIVHTTEYSYSEEVKSCMMSVCARPRTDDLQRLVSFSLLTEPRSRSLESVDVFGNAHHMFSIRHAHRALKIFSFSSVDRVTSLARPDGLSADAWNEIDSWQKNWRLWEYLHESRMTRCSLDLNAWLRSRCEFGATDPFTRIELLVRYLNQEFEYLPGATTVETTLDEFLARGAGVCQDFAHLMIAIVRKWGIPVRYVSGYVFESSSHAGTVPRSESHAWVSCLLPQLGWWDFDPTNPEASGSDYIVVGYGRDYADVSPTRGVIEGRPESSLNVSVVMRTSAAQ